MMLIVNQIYPKGHPMPRARQRPALALKLSPARRAEIHEFADAARRAGEAAKARREAVPERPKRAVTRSAGPGRGRAQRSVRAGLERQIARLAGRLAEARADGAWELAVTLNRQLISAQEKRGNLDASEGRRMEKLARRGRGKTRDRFAGLVARSDVLTPEHLEIADALRDVVFAVGNTGGTPGAVSGRAGDGEGSMVTLINMLGDAVELGERFWGAMGVPMAANKPGAAGKRPAVKRAAKFHDGGMARAADDVRHARGVYQAFMRACVDAAGAEAWAAEVAERVILRNRELEASVSACGEMRISEGRKIAETVMAAGLEAVAGRLSVAL